MLLYSIYKCISIAIAHIQYFYEKYNYALLHIIKLKIR